MRLLNNDDINGHISSLRHNMSVASGLFKKACPELFGLLTMIVITYPEPYDLSS